MDKQRKHSVDILFVITLFVVFAISVLMLTGTGAGVYQNIVDDMDNNYDSRTAGTYLFNRIHRADENGNVTVGDFNGDNAILMLEEIDNITYCTYLYYHEGNLCELFTRYGQNIDPEYGNVIIALEDYSVTKVTDTLYKFEFTTTKGESSSLYVHTHSGGREGL